jgi:hypothetical protein
MKKLIAGSLLILLVLPNLSEARRDVDRDDLDDDKETDIPVPVLFFPLEDIVPDFGAPRGGGTRTHEGQDFLAPEGTPIVSPTKAIVIGTGVWRGGGNYVQTANPRGETFRYMHLDYVANLDRGDRLDPGDFIGTVGDTGNAPDGAYHLHFEMLDEDGDPQDPHPRITKEFSLRQQMSFLRDIFREIRNDDEYARFLVDTYPTEFRTAYEEGWNLPREIDEELEDLDIEAELDSEQALRSVLGQIPALVQSGLTTGDNGVLVSLLQLYLIYSSDGPARDRLAAAGPTGYYGSITANAVREFQETKDIPETGVYDSRTRGQMLERVIVLNLKR